MITIKEFMDLVDYRITEGNDYTWLCFGDRPYSLSSWDGLADGSSFNFVFDTSTQEAYIAEVCDYKNNRAYRIINPKWKDAYNQYAEQVNSQYRDVAWDNVEFVDLDVDDDWIQKALAIKNGQEYDTRVSVPVEFSDEELLKYMKVAHDLDITFNQLVERALRSVIEEKERDNRWDSFFGVDKKEKDE